MTTLPHGSDSWTKQKVVFCGHDGYFFADVIVTPFAVVVIASKPVIPGELIRPAVGADWKIVDYEGGYWSPSTGRFVLPRKAVTRQ